MIQFPGYWQQNFTHLWAYTFQPQMFPVKKLFFPLFCSELRNDVTSQKMNTKSIPFQSFRLDFLSSGISRSGSRKWTIPYWKLTKTRKQNVVKRKKKLQRKFPMHISVSCAFLKGCTFLEQWHHKLNDILYDKNIIFKDQTIFIYQILLYIPPRYACSL